MAEPSDRNVKTVVLTGLRGASLVLVLLAVIAAFRHYDTLDYRRWDADSVLDADMAIHTKRLNDSTHLLVDPSYYHTNVSYRNSYDADKYERFIAHRVWMLPLSEGYTEFWSKHNSDDQSAGSKSPTTDDYMVVDVIDDLYYMLLITLIWISVTIGVAALQVLVGIFFPKFMEPAVNGSLMKRIPQGIYQLLVAFESSEGSDGFDQVLFDDEEEPGLLKGAFAATARLIMFLLREGFFIFVCSVSVVYAFVVLYSFQGPCASDVELPGRCSVQRTPVPTLHFVLVLTLSIIGRVASQYNYSDGNWEGKVGKMVEKVTMVVSRTDQGDEVSLPRWAQAFKDISRDLQSVATQTFSCFISIGCSAVILLVLGSAYYSIGEDRRFPYESIWWTVFTLEVILILLNLGVLLLSNITWFRNIKDLKFYIEGKLFGALFISAVTLSIYMSLRRGVNMHGTLTTQSDMAKFGHYGGRGAAAAGVDTLHGLSSAEFESMQLTFEGAFHGKQLSAHDEHCHYIPKYVFENPEDYSYDQALCAHGHLVPSDALSGQDLVDFIAANDTIANPNASSSDIAAAQQVLSALAVASKDETLYGTCCLLTEFENEGSNGTSVWWGTYIIAMGVSLQVAILVLQALVTKGTLDELGQNFMDIGNGKSGDNKAAQGTFRDTHIPRGFKTIRVV